MPLGISSTSSPPLVVASVLTYWVFRCRDRVTSPANGIKTWEYLQSSIRNSAYTAQGIDDYLQDLSKRLVVKSLKPGELTKIIRPEKTIIRLDRETGEMQELNADQENQTILGTYHDLIPYFAPQGLRERDVIQACKEKNAIVATHVRVRFEEDRTLGQDSSQDEEVIEVLSL